MTVQLNRVWAAPHDFPLQGMLAVGDKPESPEPGKTIEDYRQETRQKIKNVLALEPGPPEEPDEPSPEERLDALLECEEYRALFNYIWEDPNALDRRLVAADWLEDHGHPRAGFIRDQVELLQAARGDIFFSDEKEIKDRKERVKETMQKYGKKWTESDLRHIVRNSSATPLTQKNLDEIVRSIATVNQLFVNGFVTSPTLCLAQYIQSCRHQEYFMNLRLKLRDVRFTNVHFHELSEAILLNMGEEWRSLEIASLSNNESADMILEMISYTSRLSNLEALTMTNLRLRNINGLCSAESLPKLRHVNLSNNWITNDGIDAWPNSCTLPGLRTLDLRNNNISPIMNSMIQNSTTIPLHTRIYSNLSLALRHGPVINTKHYANFTNYAQLAHNPGDQVHSYAAETFSQLLSFVLSGKADHLLSLKIDAQKTNKVMFSDTIHNAFAALQKTRGWRQLRSLNLPHCLLKDEHLLPLIPRIPQGQHGENTGKSMLHLSPLLELDLTYNCLTVEGLKHLQSVFGFSHLRKLILDGNPIGDEGAAFIARNPELATCETMSLRNCKITTEGTDMLLYSTTLPRSGLHISVDARTIPTDRQKDWRARFGEFDE